MTGPRPAGRPWTQAEVAQLHELIASGVKVGLIARKLKRSSGAIYTRISSFRKTQRDLEFGARRLSLPSERLAFAHANAQNGREGNMSKPKPGFDVDCYRKLLAEAADDEKRLALIELLVEDQAKERLEAQRASERNDMTAATIAEVLGKSEA
jgi:hypothetical protein